MARGERQAAEHAMTETATEELRMGIGKDIRLEALADAYATIKDRPWRKADKCCEAFVKTIERSSPISSARVG